MTNSKQIHDTFGDFFGNISALAEADAKIVLPFDDSEVAVFVSKFTDQCRNPAELATFAAMLYFAGMRLKAMSELQAYHQVVPQMPFTHLVALSLLHPELKNTLEQCASLGVKHTMHSAAQRTINAL